MEIASNEIEYTQMEESSSSKSELLVKNVCVKLSTSTLVKLRIIFFHYFLYSLFFYYATFFWQNY